MFLSKSTSFKREISVSLYIATNYFAHVLWDHSFPAEFVLWEAGEIMPREAQTYLNEPVLPSSESDKKDCLLSVINLL